MKIKTKKEMKLPQLIEWAWENDVRSRMFIGSGDGIVKFGIGGLVTQLEYIDSDETFTVEVEEEITEETVIPFLVETYTNDWCVKETAMHSDNTISKILSLNKTLASMESLAFYMLNDDMTMTLIWKDGEMV